MTSRCGRWFPWAAGSAGDFSEKDAGEDGPIVREAIAAVGMAGCEERRFSTLSGGEQQRIILARALAQQTPCLILDEPTNHLDIKYQLELMDLVKGWERPCWPPSTT